MFTKLRTFLYRLLPPRDLRPEDIKPDVTDDHLGPAASHPCKRCGKPVAHPVQEYCGAACSARRKESYPQPDEVEQRERNAHG